MSKKRQSKAQRQNEVERKRDERSARRALKKERKLGEYLDKDDEDFISFANQLEVIGLKIRDIPGDGNCLFRALGDQLEGDMTDHAQHRRETVQYMLDNRGDFEPFVEDDMSFERHVESLAKQGTFGGNDSIVAFSRNHRVEVVIHQHNAPALHIHGSAGGGPVRILNLGYHHGEHYSSLRRLADGARASGAGGQVLAAAAAGGQPAARKKKSRDTTGGRNVQALISEFIGPLIDMTGCEDYETLQEALILCDFDAEIAANYVLELQEAKALSTVVSELENATIDTQPQDHPAPAATSSDGSSVNPALVTAAAAAAAPPPPAATEATAATEASICTTVGSSSHSEERISVNSDAGHAQPSVEESSSVAKLDSTGGKAVTTKTTSSSAPVSSCEHGLNAACACASAVYAGSYQSDGQQLPAKGGNGDEDAILAMQIREIANATGQDAPAAARSAWPVTGQSLDLSFLDRPAAAAVTPGAGTKNRSGVPKASIKVKVAKQGGVKVRKADKKRERKERRAEERKKEANPAEGNAVPGYGEQLAQRPDGVPKIVSI